MTINRIRHTKWFKLIALRVAFVFLINTIFHGLSFADIFLKSTSTLAVDALNDRIVTEADRQARKEGIRLFVKGLIRP